MKASELFRKYPKTPVFDHSNYRLFERIHAVPCTSNNRGLTVLFNVLKPFSTISQGRFNFQGLFKKALHIQVLFKPVRPLNKNKISSTILKLNQELFVLPYLIVSFLVKYCLELKYHQENWKQ